MTTRTGVDEKIRRLLGLPQPGGNFLTLTSLSRLFDVSLASARVVGNRYERKAVLKRVGPGLYANLLAKPTREELACLLGPPNYISFNYALLRHGISTQVPAELACVTRQRSRVVDSPWGRIRYHCFQPSLFFGFTRETLHGGAHCWLAEPEKALLDQFYLGLLDGTPPDLDELDRSRLDKAKLKRYARRFPSRYSAKLEELLG